MPRAPCPRRPAAAGLAQPRLVRRGGRREVEKAVRKAFGPVKVRTLSAAQGDTEAFAEAIGRLAGDGDLRAEYSRRARGLAETVLNRRNVVVPLLDALKTVSSPDTP